MLILVTPRGRIAFSLSIVMVSGRPASTVNSRQVLISNAQVMVSIKRANCSAESVVGVPPPIYTDSSRNPSSFTTSAVRTTSTHSNSRYCGMSFAVRSTVEDTKEQYEQRVGQNGMETYKLKDSGRESDKIFCSFPMVIRLNSVFSALTSQSP